MVGGLGCNVCVSWDVFGSKLCEWSVVGEFEVGDFGCARWIVVGV